MHVIVFSQHYFPDNFRINDLVFNTCDKIKYTVITSKSLYNKNLKKKIFYDNIKSTNVKVIRIPVIPRTNKFILSLRVLNYISYIINASLYVFFMKIEKYDHVFCYLTSPPFQIIPALILSKMSKIKLSIWYQDLWPDNLIDLKIKLPTFIYFFINKFMKFIFKNSYVIFCQSESFSKEVNKLVHNKKIITLYNPITLKFKQSHNSNQKNHQKKIFTFTGNIGANIPYQDIINSIKKLDSSKFELHFYGNGTHKLYFQKTIKKFKVNNIFIHDYLEHNELIKRMDTSSFFCIFLNNGEGLSKTIPAKFQNYLPFKKPILVYSKGVLNDLVKESQIGVECEIGDYNNLSKAFIKMANLTPDELKIIKENIENISHNFTLEKISSIYLKHLGYKYK